MDIAQTLLLALVQGITEFLPVSSSAHLVLVSDVWGYAAQSVAFDIVLHGATLLAALLYFRKDIQTIATGVIKRDQTQQSYALALLFGTVPVVIIGILIYRGIEVFRAVPVIGIVLILSGIFLFIVDQCGKRGWIRSDTSLSRKGLFIGLFQTLSLLPGVSRSGITMAAGRLVGFSRKESTRFSFLLSIPAITGALLLVSAQADITSLSLISTLPLIAAAVTAFCVAYTVIHGFLKLIERIGFTPFCVYQIVLGIVLLSVL